MLAYDDADLALLLKIRRFEHALLDLFSRGKLNGTTHTCIGQEYIPVALRTLLREDDMELSNHRGHGHYLARFEDFEGLLAEIMGKEGAVCNGVGGSQHLYNGRYLSTGIQGQGLPVACGVAYHVKQKRDGRLVLFHMGDGTWGEGSVYEALNIAALWTLPLVVAVENNHISQSTRVEDQMAGTIEGRVKGFGIAYQKITSSDISQIREALKTPFERARAQCETLVVEFETRRLGPHSKGDDTRSEDELESLRSQDWLNGYRTEHPEQLERIRQQVDREVDALVMRVADRPDIRWSGLHG